MAHNLIFVFASPKNIHSTFLHISDAEQQRQQQHNNNNNNNTNNYYCYYYYYYYYYTTTSTVAAEPQSFTFPTTTTTNTVAAATMWFTAKRNNVMLNKFKKKAMQKNFNRKKQRMRLAGAPLVKISRAFASAPALTLDGSEAKRVLNHSCL
jgi:hypothetical protein